MIQQRLAQRRSFREEQEEARPQLRPLLRKPYERGTASAWSDLLHRPRRRNSIWRGTRLSS
ncbi:hypothetical protein ACFW1M_11250 [Streptomyces inhibens]|uniref:hypothetical protein n=1 Tax=Streptomyces inhibens TaxID=2293571 RepID=UPI0036A4775F